MREISIRTFQRDFYTEIKSLPVTVTRNGKPLIVVTSAGASHASIGVKPSPYDETIGATPINTQKLINAQPKPKPKYNPNTMAPLGVSLAPKPSTSKPIGPFTLCPKHNVYRHSCGCKT